MARKNGKVCQKFLFRILIAFFMALQATVEMPESGKVAVLTQPQTPFGHSAETDKIDNRFSIFPMKSNDRLGIIKTDKILSKSR